MGRQTRKAPGRRHLQERRRRERAPRAAHIPCAPAARPLGADTLEGPSRSPGAPTARLTAAQRSTCVGAQTAAPLPPPSGRVGHRHSPRPRKAKAATARERFRAAGVAVRVAPAARTPAQPWRWRRACQRPSVRVAELSRRASVDAARRGSRASRSARAGALRAVQSTSALGNQDLGACDAREAAASRAQTRVRGCARGPRCGELGASAECAVVGHAMAAGPNNAQGLPAAVFARLSCPLTIWPQSSSRCARKDLE